MKDIVANIFLGSIISIGLGELSASANVASEKESEPQNQAIVSATALNYLDNFLLPTVFVFEIQQFDYYISPQNKNNLENLSYQEFPDFAADAKKQKISDLRKNPYLNGSDQEDIILGKHRVFWHNKNRQKYWGLTTVRTWGDNKVENLSLKNLNYLNSAPILAPGTSTLTVSGGSQRNLIKPNTLLEEIDDFQGGMAFHQSLAEEITVGLGLVYEDSLQGFSQFTYQPDNFPLRTTVSLLQGEEGLEVYSHLKLKPSDTMVFNLYSDEKDQKFDLNWGLASGLTLTADGNSETESLRAGAKLNIKHDLFSLFAKAQLDSNNKLQWEVNSQLGDFQLKYSINPQKINTEIRYKFSSLQNSGLVSSFWFQNQIRQRHKEDDNLAVWGWNLASSDISNNRPRWKFSLGYGVGSSGEGAIAKVETAIDSSLSLELSYESVSLTSDETRLKLELKSN